MDLVGASSYLKKVGSVGVIPTDTVYGLVARAEDKQAVERLYKLKQRDAKPGTVIAASIDQLVELGLKRRYLTAVSDYWPAALSVIIPCGVELSYLHLGKFGLAVRLPDDKDLIKLLSDVGPLLTSSANSPNHKPATTVKEARGYFKDQVDFYINGGDLSGNQPSTIVKIIDDAIEVIRLGAVKINSQS